ncbi:MAG: general secretion pathway protein GspK [Pseudomonadota bacterium]|nr:general secretion pathway protein GspK [Pseudomonadota bacterium]
MGRATGSDGYITLAVLVIAGLLAASVATLITVSRPAIDTARLGADKLAADGLVDGGLAAAGYLLFRSEREPSAVDGTTLRFGTGSVRLGVTDEGGRIGLNIADPELLAGLFGAAGGSSMSPAAFAARIMDWRDEDSEPTEAGAESEEYASAELGYGPRNGPFRSPDELRLLIGLSGGDFNRLEPFLTTFSNSGLIDPRSAPRTVLLAIPGLTRADVERLIEARRAGTRDREALVGLVEGSTDYFGTEPSGAYRVVMQARLKAGFSEAAEAVLVAATDETADFGVVAWTRLAPGTRSP